MKRNFHCTSKQNVGQIKNEIAESKNTIITEAKEGINAQERIPCWAEKLSYTYYPCTGKQGI
jgi:hypothetical protein